MTCVLATRGRGFATMGADRQLLDGWVSHHAGAPKIVVKDGWLLGTAGPVRVNNAVKHAFTPPVDGHEAFARWSPLEIERWIYRVFVPSLREQMVATETAVVEGWLGGKEGEQQGTVVVAHPQMLFTVQADWAVDLWADWYVSAGSGHRFALAVMSALAQTRDVAREDDHVACVKLAVGAAIQWDPYCGGTVDVLTTKG